MRCKNLACLLIIFFYSSLFAQKQTNEELFKDTGSATDSVRLKATYQIAKKYLRINLDTCEQFANEAARLAKKINSKKIEAESYALLGAAKKYRGKFEQSITFHLQALAIKETITGDPYGMSITLNDLGILYKNMRRYDEAINYYRRSLFFSQQANHIRSQALTTNNIGTIYMDRAIYDSATFYFDKALPLATQSGDSNALVIVLSNLGEMYGKNKNYNESLVFFYKCLPIDKALDDKYGIITDHLNIGASLMKLKKFQQAKPHLDSANTIASTEGFAKEKINTKYETSKKEQQLLKQQLQLTQRNYLIAGISGVLFLGSLLGFSYYRRNKLKQEKKLQQEVIKQQDLSTKAVIAAEENERKRIAADLHDGVGQMMSAAKMNLSAFENDIPFKDEYQKMSFEKIIDLVDESCKEIRSVSHQMMPNALLKSGLASAIKEFIDKIDNRILKINLHTEGLNERLDSNVETVLYRVIQECVNNVIKHSGANSLDISLIKDIDGIAATIEDNGKGFDSKDKQKFDGIGLKNIMSRIGFLKGTVDFDSSPGNGTLVAIHVPLV